MMLLIFFWILHAVTLGLCQGRRPLEKQGRRPPEKHKDGVTFSLKRTIDLDFNPAFAIVDDRGGHSDLYLSSFFNVERFGPNQTFFERDLVARIPDIDKVAGTKKPKSSLVVQKLTDLVSQPKLVWPNEISRAPKGVFPFDALGIPQGFLTAPEPGRLTAIDVHSPNHTEYVIQQSTISGSGFTSFSDPNNSPRFYHRVLYLDMNGDGAIDIVTVRSGVRAVPIPYPPSGELLWFENPGLNNIMPDVPWTEHLIFGGPLAGFQGPDIFLRSFDFDGDGVPEIVATHLFTGAKIALYGIPPGASSWTDVDGLDPGKQPRVANLVTDQGDPFDIDIVDLNQDGRMDILATNGQPDGIRFPSVIPGRVFAIEQPASGNIFTDPWPVHVLLDNIRPNPSLPNSPASRGAPGKAITFYSSQGARPWIAVSGDESGKVWILKPTVTNWVYTSKVLFDINVFYGPNTTQTVLTSGHPLGIAIGTVGALGVGYTGPKAEVELFVPVFEARQIHVFQVNPVLILVPKCKDCNRKKSGSKR